MPLFQDKNGGKMPLFQEFGAGQGDCAVLEWRHENDSDASCPGGAGYGSGTAPSRVLGGRGTDAAAPGSAAKCFNGGKPSAAPHAQSISA